MGKTNSEFKAIRKKLMAAVAMVLVAGIMVISSSYAWFTLSTAPEVTGIKTSVGSNGNLEIALRTNANGSGIGNTEGATDFPGANIFWGNLVDLSDASYHLDDITLLPSALVADKRADEVIEYLTNEDGDYVDADGNVIAESELETKGVVKSITPAQYWFTGVSDAQKSYIKVPTYGADGRVSGFNPNSFSDVYDTNAKGFPASTAAHGYGVRAVGVNSGMSPEELLMLNARRAVSTAAGVAENGAISSLRYDATKIANIAVKKQLDTSGTADYTSDVKNVRAAIVNMQTITVSLEDAVRSAVVALGVSQGKNIDKAVIQFTASDITTGDVTLEWSKAAVGQPGDADYVAGFDYTAYKTALIEAYQKISAMNGVLSTASTGLTPYENGTKSCIGNDAYTGLVGVVASIMNPDDIKIEGKTIAQYNGNLSQLASDLMGGQAVVSIESGIYRDIALFVGNYNTPAKMHVEGTFPAPIGAISQDVSVNMATNATQPANGWYLDSTSAWLSTMKAQAGATGGVELMTDLYGYAIDLAFRTNAYGSNLLLQTEAADRVYTDAAEGSVTQGGGSYMEFTAGHANFTIAQMANLMKNVRVIFTDDTTGNIIAVAGLDVEAGAPVQEVIDEKPQYWEVDANGEPTTTKTETVTAFPVYIQAEDAEGNKLYVDDQGHYTTAASGNEAVYDTIPYEIVDVEGRTVRAKLYLYDFEINNGQVTLGARATKQSIMSLDQNAVETLTALVYLDGNEVTNSDVAVGGNSMTGKLNLQFASDANLDPMDYTFGERLATPEIALDGSNLTVSKVENAATYDIYVGSTKVYTIDNADGGSYTLPTTATAEIPAGTYNVTVIAKAPSYTNSLRSEAVQITVQPATGG